MTVRVVNESASVRRASNRRCLGLYRLAAEPPLHSGEKPHLNPDHCMTSIRRSVAVTFLLLLGIVFPAAAQQDERRVAIGGVRTPPPVSVCTATRRRSRRRCCSRTAVVHHVACRRERRAETRWRSRGAITTRIRRIGSTP